MKNQTTRRTFLGASGAAAAAWTGARSYAAGASANPGPNDVINLGLIGCGARGRTLIIPQFGKMPGARFVAVCDVNAKYLAESRELAGGDRVAATRDFRKLIEDKNVDAVIVATNQQWHVIPMVAACQAGKDVYLEKPLGQSIGEGPYAVEAWRKYGRIVQAGTQQRSQEHYQKAVELIQAGKLGTISEVRVWDYENYWPGAGSPPDCPPPAELDWDFYVGPSPFRNYNPNIYYNYGYDWFKVAGAGHQVAWGVHHFDIVLWAMQVNWPKKVYATGGQFAFVDNYEYPNTFSATVEFGPGPVAKHGFLMQYTMRTGGRRETRAHGKCFIGSDASMILDRAGYSIVKEVPRGEKIVSTGPLINPEATVLPAEDRNRHFEVFLDNIRRRKQSTATPETLHYATAVGHLMNMSWETGRAIAWDGKTNQAADDPAANNLVLRPYRAPWKLGA
ncbi:MAG: Gfo/Idh/MocA family oxidoreductase [Bryobacteraceae bacterium]|nr:Gfo/Idh/MocA family oxidoreductase [Bryobacteraceae bacterium]